MEDRIRGMCCLQMQIGRMRHRVIDRRIQKLGIHPAQHFLLVQLSRAGEAPSQARLAEEMNVSPALVARTLKNLESGGYILREDCEADGRRNRVRITEKGAEVLSGGMEIFRDVDARSFEGFSDEDIVQFHRLLEKMHANMTRVDLEEKEMREE